MNPLATIINPMATAEILQATKEAVEKSKGSFDMLGAIREHMGELALRNYVDGFVGPT